MQVGGEVHSPVDELYTCGGEHSEPEATIDHEPVPPFADGSLLTAEKPAFGVQVEPLKVEFVGQDAVAVRPAR